MKRLVILMPFFVVLIAGCGEYYDPCQKITEAVATSVTDSLILKAHPHSSDVITTSTCSEKEAQSEFLFAFIGLILALGITNLIKGFDVLIKRSPKNWIQEMTTLQRPNRWQFRLLWGVSLTLLIFQLVWGMRLVLDKATELFYFAYYVALAGIVYSMVVYVFPENTDDVFEKEDKNGSLHIWSPSITRRLYKLYFIYTAYLLGTVPVSIKFYLEDKDHPWYPLHWSDGNLIGILLKMVIGLVFYYAWRKKRRLVSTMKEGDRTIFLLDYLLIVASIVIHIFYLVIRTRNLW